jgi:hypothetical protein
LGIFSQRIATFSSRTDISKRFLLRVIWTDFSQPDLLKKDRGVENQDGEIEEKDKKDKGMRR